MYKFNTNRSLVKLSFLKLKCLLFVLINFSVFNYSNAQSCINNIKVQQIGDELHIKYDLLPSYEDKVKIRYYKVRLFYSIDNGKTFKEVIENTQGNIGKVGIGKNKTIVWKATNSFNYIGKLKIKLDCHEIIPVVLNFPAIGMHFGGEEYMFNLGISWSVLFRTFRGIYHGIQVSFIFPLESYGNPKSSVAIAYRWYNPRKIFSMSFGINIIKDPYLITPVWAFIEFAFVFKNLTIPINLSLFSANSVAGVGIGYKF